MNRFLTLVTVTILSTSAANAAAHVEFFGGLCIKSANSACVTNGWNVGTCFVTRYSPRDISDEGSMTSLSLFGGQYAVGIVSSSASLIGTTFQPVTVWKVGVGGYSFNAKARITSQAPAAPTATTPFISFEGDIQKWDDITDCNVSFKATQTLCPNNGYC